MKASWFNHIVLKLKPMYYLGIDVSKQKLDCCLYFEGLDGRKKHKRIANDANGFTKLMHWLTQHLEHLNDVSVAMEATNIYHEPCADVLSYAGLSVYVLNPARVKAFAKGIGLLVKTDKVDSDMLARYIGMNQGQDKLNQYQPTPEHIGYMKALMMRRDALAKDLHKERNRLAQAKFKQLPKRIESSIEDSIVFIQAAITKLDDDINQLINKHPDLKQDKDLLTSIPAIGERSANLMVSLLKTHQFKKPSQLAAYLGLVPMQHQSGKSIHKPSRISKTSASKPRAQLYMAAVSAIQHNPLVKAHYDKLVSRGKAKMQALIAGLKKLVYICFGVIKNQTPFDARYLENITKEA